eukprot:maker-scaffold_32-snap-gene-0.0-mRNA-1 protein AED:0.13 eAED:0.13 QI:66/0/0.5/1/1/1/2/0/467
MEGKRIQKMRKTAKSDSSDLLHTRGFSLGSDLSEDNDFLLTSLYHDLNETGRSIQKIRLYYDLHEYGKHAQANFAVVSSVVEFKQALETSQHALRFKFRNISMEDLQKMKQILEDFEKKQKNYKFSKVTFTCLSFQETGLSKKNFTYFVSCFQNYVSDLVFLDLRRNKIDKNCCDQLSTLLENALKLEDLCISYNRINNEAMSYLARGLKNNNTLEGLDLSHNYLTSQGAKTALQITALNKIKSLNLSYNNIGDKGAACAARLLKSKTKCFLETLLLTRNNISDKSGLIFVEALNENKMLKELHLYDNELTISSVEKLALRQVKRRMEQPNAENLSITLSSNHVDDKIYRLISNALIEEHPFVFSPSSPGTLEIADKCPLLLMSNEGCEILIEEFEKLDPEKSSLLENALFEVPLMEKVCFLDRIGMQLRSRQFKEFEGLQSLCQYIGERFPNLLEKTDSRGRKYGI